MIPENPRTPEEGVKRFMANFAFTVVAVMLANELTSRCNAIKYSVSQVIEQSQSTDTAPKNDSAENN